MELVDTTDLPLHHLFRNTRLKIHPSRHRLKSMRVAHPSTMVRHHLPSPKALTRPTDMVRPHPHSQAATTHTTDMVHTNTTAGLVVAAAVDVEAHGVAAVTSAHPLVHQPSCRT